MSSEILPRVIISNGFARFHLAVASTALHSLGFEVILLTGAYPTPRLKKFLTLTRLSKGRKISRLLDREEEIPFENVHSDYLSESMRVLGMMIKDIPLLKSLYRYLDLLSLKVYGMRAKKKIRMLGKTGDIYHYRAGFGGVSVSEAKSIGMLLLCDHTIAHPYVLDYMVSNEGKWPSNSISESIDSRWKYILKDIEQAKEILTISNFVKDTFTHMGWDGRKIHVICLGVDEKFYQAIPKHEPVYSERTRLLFAGLFEKRKGAVQILEALRKIEDLDFQLDVAGNIGDEYKDELLNDPRVNYLGLQSRTELAETMFDADIFVFPTLAEGPERGLTIPAGR